MIAEGLNSLSLVVTSVDSTKGRNCSAKKYEARLLLHNEWKAMFQIPKEMGPVTSWTVHFI